MNAEQIIPPIADRCKSYNWPQPHRRFIELDDECALMSEQTFRGLKECATLFPQPPYVGKMWKKNIGGKWFLCWIIRTAYSHAIEKREILVL